MTAIPRRTVLAGLSVSLTAAALGLRPSQTAWATSPSPTPTASPFVKPRVGEDPVAPTGPGWTRPRTPYSLSSSVSLSEDYFTSNQVILGDASDQLLAFQGPTGASALVLANQQVSHLYRDPSSPSGWSYTQLAPKFPLGATAVHLLAVGTDADGTVWALFANTGFTVAGWLDPDQGWQYQNPHLGGHQRLRATYDANSNLFFYEVYSDGTIGWYKPSKAGMPMQTETRVAGVVEEFNETITDGYLALSGLDSSGLMENGTIFANVSGGSSATFTTGGQHGQFPDSTTITGGILPGHSGFGWYGVWVDNNAQLSALSPTGPVDVPPGGLSGAVTQATVQQVDVSESDTGYALLVQSGFQTSLVTLNDSFEQPTAVIPLLSQATQIAAPAVGTLDGFFYVDANYAVNYLACTPGTTAWQTYPIHQGGEVNYSVQVWRTELTLSDANNAPLTGVDLSISVETPTDLWLDTGGVLLSPGASTTFTTNALGRVTLSIPAKELSVPPFTVRADNLAPVVVAPDADVHAYLAGTGPLHTLPAMSGTAVQNAQASDGSPVFPNISSDTAGAVAGAVQVGMAAGATAGQAPAAGTVQSFNLAMANGAVVYSPSNSPQDLDEATRRLARLGKVESIGSWWNSVKGDAESVYHGIRAGAIAVEHVAASYVAEAGAWAMKLAITIGDDVSDVIDLAVTDLKSAVHFVSAVFHALGAAIEKAIEWLAAEITSLFKQTAIAADTLLGWIHQVPDAIPTLADELAHDLDGFVQEQLGSLQQWFDDRKAQYAGKPINDLGGSTMLQRQPGPLKDTSPAGPPGASSAHSNWLLHKIEHLFPTVALSVSDDATQAFSAMVSRYAPPNDTLLTGIEDVVGGIWNALVGAAEDPKDFATVGLDALLGAVEGLITVVVDLLTDLAETLVGVVKALFADISGFVDLPLDDIPLLGDLLRLAGVPDTLTFGRLGCLIAMFPAVLANQIVHGKDAALFANVSTGAKTTTKTTVGSAESTGLTWAAFGCQLMLAVITPVQTVQNDPNDPVVKNPFTSFLTYIGLIVSLANLAVNYPGDPSYQTEPFSKHMPSDTIPERLARWVYGLSYGEVGLNLMGNLLDLDPLDPAYAENVRINAVLTCALGGFLSIGGATSKGLSGYGVLAAGNQLLCELPTLMGFLNFKGIRTPTSDTSMIALVCIEIICDLAAAALLMGI